LMAGGDGVSVSPLLTRLVDGLALFI
jgi:hypothetical protein